MTNQALILAGGFGTRLGELTRTTPKPMVDVAGRPFLEYLVWNLARHGIRDILFSVGYLADDIRSHFGAGSQYGVSIDYAIEDVPAGTGGGVKLALDKLADEFFVLNGDTLFDINYLDLALARRAAGASAALALRRVEDCTDYGSVALKDGVITSFREKQDGGSGLVSGGVYHMSREAVESMGDPPFSIEEDFFPTLVDRGSLSGREFDGYFIDIGTPRRLAASQAEIPAWQKKPAVFFDRDGVINVNYGYVHSPDKFTWIDGAPEAIKLLNDLGWLVFVVTNQSGIGRGYYTEEQFHEFSAWIDGKLREHGAHIDQTYFCPHHPTEALGEYNRACPCRKPEPGMLRKAYSQWSVDMDKSFMIGDKESDVQTAGAVGMKGVLYTGGNLLDLVRRELGR